ncbi:MAG: hypothetical protein RLY87_2669 [Chloroflexota bacterium]
MSYPVERICPQCRASQALSATYCNSCGSPIERSLPQPLQRFLPAALRQHLTHPVVRSVAMGALVMVAQVVIRVVQQNLAQSATRALTKSQSASQPASAQTTVTARRTFWQKTDKHGTIRSEERVSWQRTEK